MIADSIIVAIIAGVCSVIGNALIYRKKSQEDAIADAQREQRQLDRLDRIDEKMETLEKKVDIHNGYAEKFGDITNQITSMAKDIEFLKENRSVK